MKRPPEYYTVWNLAVEAVEIYLDRNPREVDQQQINRMFRAANAYLRNTAGKWIDARAALLDPQLYKVIARCLPTQ